MLEAVLFDFGNTLVSTNVDWASIVPRELEGLQRALEPYMEGIDWPRLGADFLFLRSQGRERANRELREVTAIECLRTALSLQGRENPPSEVLQAGVDGFFGAEEAAYPIVFGIPEVLAKLREMGLRLAVVSNATCGKLIRRALERRRMLGFFEQVVVSADIGIRKPDPEIFLLAARALDCSPADCAMVGDNPEADCDGAKKAGMRAVLACLLGQPEPEDSASRPDVVVRSPAQLVELFGQWRDPD